MCDHHGDKTLVSIILTKLCKHILGRKISRNRNNNKPDTQSAIFTVVNKKTLFNPPNAFRASFYTRVKRTPSGLNPQRKLIFEWFIQDLFVSVGRPEVWAVAATDPLEESALTHFYSDTHLATVFYTSFLDVFERVCKKM